MINILYAEKKLTAGLSGEIDHHSAAELRKKIDMSVKESVPSELVLDFENVTFMDSSGIGLIMGRYKLMDEIGGKVYIQNAPEQIKKVMKLAGIERLAQIL